MVTPVTEATVRPMSAPVERMRLKLLQRSPPCEDGYRLGEAMPWMSCTTVTIFG